MILDYKRISKDGKIIVPPFHTGHLGFVHNTDVYVTLLSTPQDLQSHCEIIVTPFSTNFSTLSHLRCIMDDRPGVVYKLIEAVASLGINISGKESSAINSLGQHVVELVLDWGTSSILTNEETPPAIVSKFNLLSLRIPIHLKHFFTLYQAIMIRCGDVITIDHDYGIPLPSLTITPFGGTSPNGGTTREAKITRDEANLNKFHMEFKVPDSLLYNIRRKTHFVENDEPLPYIISSESNSRCLRVFFPHKNLQEKILHIAFNHADTPGALLSITRVLADKNFNILTGLLRKKDKNRSGYELILEYKGDDIPKTALASHEGLLNWVTDLINTSDEDTLALLSEYAVTIGLPEYPKRKISLTHKQVINPSSFKPSSKEKLNESKLIAQCIADLTKNNSIKKEIKTERLKLLNLLAEGIDRKPIIFMSYPESTKSHANLLKDAINKEFPDHFKIEDYQERNLEPIKMHVLKLIRECDFFLGIWHHESEFREGGANVSPWMPFEYGIAVSAGKETAIIYSDKLSKELIKRIEGEKSNVSYSDLYFSSETIQFVLHYINLHWYKKLDS